MHDFLNAFALAVVTDRTIVWRFSPATSDAMGLTLAQCDAVVRRRAWTGRCARAQNTTSSAVCPAKGSTEASARDPRRLACAARRPLAAGEPASYDIDASVGCFEWQEAALLAHPRVLATLPPAAAERTRTLFSLGADMAMGALWDAYFHFDEAAVVQETQRALVEAGLQVASAGAGAAVTAGAAEAVAAARAGAGPTRWVAVHMRHQRASDKGLKSAAKYWPQVRSLLLDGGSVGGVGGGEDRGTPVSCAVFLAADRPAPYKHLKSLVEEEGCVFVRSRQGASAGRDFKAWRGKERGKGGWYEHGPFALSAAMKDLDLLSHADSFVGTTGSSFTTSIGELIAARGSPSTDGAVVSRVATSTRRQARRLPRFSLCDYYAPTCVTESTASVTGAAGAKLAGSTFPLVRAALGATDAIDGGDPLWTPGAYPGARSNRGFFSPQLAAVLDGSAQLGLGDCASLLDMGGASGAEGGAGGGARRALASGGDALALCPADRCVACDVATGSEGEPRIVMYSERRYDGTGSVLQHVIYAAAYAASLGMQYGGAYGQHNKTRPAEHVSGFELGRGVEFVFGVVDATKLLFPDRAASPLNGYRPAEVIEVGQPREEEEAQRQQGQRQQRRTFPQQVGTTVKAAVLRSSNVLLEEAIDARGGARLLDQFLTHNFVGAMRRGHECHRRRAPFASSLFAPGRTSVAMHLRRGVVNRGDKWRYTKMSYYATVLETILTVRPDADVHIFSSEVRVRKNEQMWSKEVVRREARCVPTLVQCNTRTA